MDLYKLAESLTTEEQTELYDILFEKRKERAVKFAKENPISSKEWNMFVSPDHSTVDIIKAIRIRLNCSFLEAKAILDNALNKK